MLRKLMNNKGSAFVVTIWATLVLLGLGTTAVFITTNQREATARDINVLNALNIAEAAVNERIEDWADQAKAGTLNWSDANLLGTTTGTVSNGNNEGDYSLTVSGDGNSSANKLLSSTGTYNGVSKQVTITLKAFPQIFSFAAASNVKLEVKAEEDGPLTILGPIHGNGNLEITVEGDGVYDFSQAQFTYSGSLILNPSDIEGTFTPAPAVELPQINIDYYRNQANFADQTVFNIDLSNPPAYMAPYLGADDEDVGEFEYKIPAADVDGLWGANSIVNFYWPGGTYKDDLEVQFEHEGATQITLTQTFTADNFEEMEFEGNIKLLPYNGQAVIGYNIKKIEIEGGVQVGEIGNGAMLYTYGSGVDEDGEGKGKVEMEDNTSLYGSVIQNMDPDYAQPKLEIQGGCYIQFDGAFIDKMGQGTDNQFLNWGTFDLKKVSYEQ